MNVYIYKFDLYYNCVPRLSLTLLTLTFGPSCSVTRCQNKKYSKRFQKLTQN